MANRIVVPMNSTASQVMQVRPSNLSIGTPVRNPISSDFTQQFHNVGNALDAYGEQRRKEEKRDKIIEAMKVNGAREAQLAYAHANPENAIQQQISERVADRRTAASRAHSLRLENLKTQRAAELRQQLHQERLKRNPFRSLSDEQLGGLGMNLAQAEIARSNPDLGNAILKNIQKKGIADIKYNTDRNPLGVTREALVFKQKADIKKSNETQAGLEKSADSAREVLGLFETAKVALNDPQGAPYTGVGGDYVNKALQVMDALGIASDDQMRKMRGFSLLNAVSKRLAVLGRGTPGEPGFLAGATSNKDIEFLIQQTISPNNRREQNLAIIEGRSRIVQTRINIHKMALEYKQKHGILDDGFQRQVNEYYEKNPIVTDELKKRILGETEVKKVRLRDGRIVTPDDARAIIKRNRIQRRLRLEQERRVPDAF